MDVLKSNINGTLRAGEENFGGWNTYAGGRVTTASTTTRDPGATYGRTVPGRKTIESVTLTRVYDNVRDAQRDEERLEALAGTQTVFTVGKVIRDGAQNVTSIKTRVGKLLEVMGGEGDTNSDAELATLEVVIGIDG